MAEKIKLVRNDTGPQLMVTLTEEASGDPLDLSGATVTLHFRAANSTTVLFSRQGTINPDRAAFGEVVISWQEGDLDLEPGDYEGEIESVMDSGMRQTAYEILKFKLRSDMA